MGATEELTLDKDRHIKYWQRCLKSLLPTQYTSMDSSRMTLGCFILSALDLLGAGASTFPSAECAKLKSWILKCQHPSGGFCGSPNHRYPDGCYQDVGGGKREMDPANLPATFFALLCLGFVESLEEVKRRECLKWLRRLQREYGSFGELVTEEGSIGGGKDMRYCMIAAAIRWMLRGSDVEKKDEQLEDIDVDKLEDYIRAGQTYDGGISESSQHEAHAGYTYCALAALSLLGRLPDKATERTRNGSSDALSISAVLRWLMTRQQEYTEVSDGHDTITTEGTANHLGDNQSGLAAVAQLSIHDSDFIGFNGRCNKPVDTCYSFWVGASLDILDKSSLIDTTPNRRFLLQKTQHRIGGFGKFPGDPPDIFHSYLGLAALAVTGEPGLKKLDSPLCISIDAKKNLERLRNDPSVPRRRYWLHGYCFEIREDDPRCKEMMAKDEGPPKQLAEAFAGAAVN